MDSIHLENSKTRSYYGYMMEQMLIATDPIKNLLNEDTFDQTPEHIQQIYKLYYFPVVEAHRRVCESFKSYTEKLRSGNFYDGPLEFNKEKMHEFQIFVDCSTQLVQSSRKFILDYAKLKPEIFELCDMSLLVD